MAQPPTAGELQIELDRVRKEFDAFRRYLPDALVEGDLTTQRVLSMNRMAQILFGYDDADIEAGVSGLELFSSEELPRALALIQKYVSQSRAEGTPYERTGTQDLFEQELKRKDGTTFWAETQTSFVLDENGVPQGMRTLIRDITARRKAENERQRIVIELQDALKSVRQLRSLLPVCSDCKRIRDDAGEWTDLETYVRQASGSDFADTVCTDCDSRRARGNRLAW
jgi:PAS domain S-box-containing protein